MKTLELNQMETFIGGDAQCSMGMGFNAIIGGMFFGPIGYLVGAAIGYHLNC